MYLYISRLIWAILLSSVTPALAQNNDNDGLKLYNNAVSTAKLHIQPGRSDYQVFDETEALKISQGAMGKQLGDYTFLNRSRHTVRLSDYRGKPLVIDMVYTHCPLVCATKTWNLKEALKPSIDALGADSFNVLTIGFDTENDTPDAMDAFAKRMNVNLHNWEFVSADSDTVKKLSKDLGFVFSPSPIGGFDHITQTTFIDRQGRVYQQIYGEEFENKTLLEPLKNIISNIKASAPIYNLKTAEPGSAGIAKSVRLFCSTYDPKTGTYTTDYGRLYGMGLDLIGLFIFGRWIVIQYRRNPKRNYPDHASDA
jgi:protein SCO1/2